jgi:hypothetical protein
MLDITTLAAWGEFIGGIAVVVSLVYLASQIRQNSRLLRVSATSTTAQITMGQNEMLCEDSEVSRIFWDGCRNPDSLSPEDGDRLSTMLIVQIQGHHQSFEFHLTGIGSEASWRYTDHAMRWFAAQSGFRSFWLENQQAYMPAFRDYVDGLIHEGEAAE